MVAKKTLALLVISACLLLAARTTASETAVPSEKETKEFNEDLARVKAMEKSLIAAATKDLAKYETFADAIERKWRQRDKVCYARLMAAICETLTGGRVNWAGAMNAGRIYEICAKYALLALTNREAIPLALELELLARTAPGVSVLEAPDQAFPARRKESLDIMLHAWKRLNGALDPKWNDIKLPIREDEVFATPGLRYIPPNEIQKVQDPALRAKYEAAEKAFYDKVGKHLDESNLHHVAERFARTSTGEIVALYSTPPYNVAELKKGLDDYGFDEKTKASILDAVAKNIDEAKNPKPKPSSTQPAKGTSSKPYPSALPIRIPPKNSGG